MTIAHYEIYVVENDEYWYVGSASGNSSAEKRFQKHIAGKGADGFKNILDVQFTFRILETGLDDVIDREQHWFEIFQAIDVRKCLNKKAPKASWPSTLPGTHLSEERRQKISKSRRGTVLSIETRMKISKSLKGHEVSVITRQKIGDIHAGKIVTDDVRKKISESRMGHVVSISTRQKISEARRKQ
jgi:predicted GIY-YIG superfamily endonuclease